MGGIISWLVGVIRTAHSVLLEVNSPTLVQACVEVSRAVEALRNTNANININGLESIQRGLEALARASVSASVTVRIPELFSAVKEFSKALSELSSDAKELFKQLLPHLSYFQWTIRYFLIPIAFSFPIAAFGVLIWSISLVTTSIPAPVPVGVIAGTGGATTTLVTAAIITLAAIFLVYISNSYMSQRSVSSGATARQNIGSTSASTQREMSRIHVSLLREDTTIPLWYLGCYNGTTPPPPNPVEDSRALTEYLRSRLAWPHDRVLAVWSVIGLQQSGKTTALNNLSNTNFPSRRPNELKERMTTGMDIALARDFVTVLNERADLCAIDVEGIDSPERKDALRSSLPNADETMIATLNKCQELRLCLQALLCSTVVVVLIKQPLTNANVEPLSRLLDSVLMLPPTLRHNCRIVVVFREDDLSQIDLAQEYLEKLKSFIFKSLSDANMSVCREMLHDHAVMLPNFASVHQWNLKIAELRDVLLTLTAKVNSNTFTSVNYFAQYFTSTLAEVVSLVDAELYTNPKDILPGLAERIARVQAITEFRRSIPFPTPETYWWSVAQYEESRNRAELRFNEAYLSLHNNNQARDLAWDRVGGEIRLEFDGKYRQCGSPRLGQTGSDPIDSPGCGVAGHLCKFNVSSEHRHSCNSLCTYKYQIYYEMPVIEKQWMGSEVVLTLELTTDNRNGCRDPGQPRSWPESGFPEGKWLASRKEGFFRLPDSSYRVAGIRYTGAIGKDRSADFRRITTDARTAFVQVDCWSHATRFFFEADTEVLTDIELPNPTLHVGDKILVDMTTREFSVKVPPKARKIRVDLYYGSSLITSLFLRGNGTAQTNSRTSLVSLNAAPYSEGSLERFDIRFEQV